VGDVYRFNDTEVKDSFLGDVADESNFDFDTAKGTGADPFTVVMYASASSTDVANKNEPTIRKALGHFGDAFPDTKGWHVSYIADFAVRIPVVRQFVGEELPNRLQANFEDAIGNSDTDMHLLVYHIPGDGVNTNVQLYLDGNATSETVAPRPERPEFDRLAGSVLNDDPLEIGRGNSIAGWGDNEFIGDIQFIEIYSGTTIDNNLGTGMTPSEYSGIRFANLGTIVEAGEFPLGDMDCDGDVDFDDIDPFVLGLNDPAQYELDFGVPPEAKGDMDGDGDFDFDDIEGFVAALQGGGPQSVPEPSGIALGGLAALALLSAKLARRRQRK
jgi:hypothetical protein